MTTVTLTHLRTIPGYGPKPGFCAGAARDFCKRYDLDWHAFRHQGLPAEQLEATGDAMAIALVEWARQCEVQDGRG